VSACAAPDEFAEPAEPPFEPSRADRRAGVAGPKKAEAAKAAAVAKKADATPEKELTLLEQLCIRINTHQEGNKGRPVKRMPTVTPEQMRAQVKARGPRKWLLEGLWMETTALLIGADEKFGKSICVLDLAVSLASGTPWMNAISVQLTGPVIIWVLEDDDSEVLRRLDAICTARGLDLDELPIYVCFLAPNLSSAESLLAMEYEIALHQPIAAIIDPLYLAIGEKGDGSDLYGMGPILNGFKNICRPYRCAPVLLSHWNKTGEGTGRSRITGVGTTHWARTIVSASSAGTPDIERFETTAEAADEDGSDKPVTQLRVTSTLRFEFSGNSFPAQNLIVRRRMWADDPLDLDSPLHYEAELVEAASTGADQGPPKLNALTAAARVLVALEKSQTWMSAAQIQKWDALNLPLTAKGVANALRTTTVAGALAKHAEAAAIQRDGENGQTAFYASPDVLAEFDRHHAERPF
jgi:hypothetical protein